MSKSYQDAVDCLRSRLRPFRSGPIKNHPNVMHMKEWLSEIGCENPSDLNVIHITGTKGKGSTAAYTESFIRAHSHFLARPTKVGLYTSPHLVTERERIRINFEPISEELFTTSFFEVWNILYNKGWRDRMPGYLQLLALLSVYVFKNESVDVAVYEVHAGGRKDATNIFERPLACGFTTIGLDHVNLLGDTVESIAEHKSGIMKRGRPAFSSLQNEPRARKVLEREAKAQACAIEFVEISAELPEHPCLKPFVQKQNASLAIRLANAYLGLDGYELNQETIAAGVGLCKWPGRFQKLSKGNAHWSLDCAHNSLSISVALSWFISEARTDAVSQYDRCWQVLIFGHESSRNVCDLIALISKICSQQKFEFDLVILSPYKRYGQRVHDSVVIEEHATFWQLTQPLAQVARTRSLNEAINMVEERCSRAPHQILVTGSTHLVGHALELLVENRYSSDTMNVDAHA